MHSRLSGNYFVLLLVMQDETVYYKSPIGMLEIRSRNNNICSLIYVNTKNRQPTDESSIKVKGARSPIMKKCITQLDHYFRGSCNPFDIELDQEGTTFQQSVWNELKKIRYGKTITYQELSNSLGNSKAIRAVGAANGKNNIAIIVPCHRVIGSKGALVGYGGDLWRKHWLLNHEAKHANGVQFLF